MANIVPKILSKGKRKFKKLARSRKDLAMESIAVDCDSLVKYLANNWDMPSDAWWDDADSKFKLLRTFFECGERSEESREEPDANLGDDALGSETTQDSNPADKFSNADSTTVPNDSPESARIGVSPVVTLLKAGTHLMGVTALNDELTCLAFGTISSTLFVDVFWDTVAKIKKHDVEIEVFQASSPMPDLYRLSFCGYKFSILYFHCNDLLRKYPNVWNAPVSFLDKLDAEAGTKRALELYHENRKYATFFQDQDWRAGYYAIRAWGLVRLCYTNQALAAGALTPKIIVQTIHEAFQTRLWKYFDYRSIFSSFLCEIDYQSLHLLNVDHKAQDRREEDIGKLLNALNSQNLHQRLGYPKYLIIRIIWTGTSDLRASKWVERMDHRVKLLARRQLVALNHYAKPPYLVPHRLVRPSDEQSQSSLYQAYYVIGLPDFDMESAATPLVPGVENWIRQTMEDDISKGRGFIHTEFRSSLQMEKETFRLCTRDWPREPIKNPNGKYEIEEDMDKLNLSGSGPKRQKLDIHTLQGQKGTLKGPKLRPAIDILNRLRHDENYRIDEWVVGYLDRHSPQVQEKPVADWEGETTHEEFIPEHRIEYFKKSKGGVSEVHWDKNLRRDWIFNSGVE